MAGTKKVKCEILEIAKRRNNERRINFPDDKL